MGTPLPAVAVTWKWIVRPARWFTRAAWISAAALTAYSRHALNTCKRIVATLSQQLSRSHFRQLLPLEEGSIFVKYLPVSVGKEIFPQFLLRDESACLPVNCVNGADRHLPVHWNNQYFFMPGSFEWTARKFRVATLHRDHFKTEPAGNTQDFA